MYCTKSSFSRVTIEQRLFSRDCCHLSIISYRLYNMYYVFSYGLFDYCTDSRPNKKAKSSNSVSQRRAVYQKALSLKLRLRIMVVQAIYNYFYTRQYDDKKSLKLRCSMYTCSWSFSQNHLDYYIGDDDGVQNRPRQNVACLSRANIATPA